MNTRLRDFFGFALLSLFFGFLVVYVVGVSDFKSKQLIIPKHPTQKQVREQVQYLRDSFEMEYYKKQLESFPFEHSKIPNQNNP